MAYAQEADLSTGNAKPEQAFHDAVAEEIEGMLRACLPPGEWFLMHDFGLDIVVFVRRGGQAAVRFLELKAYLGARQNAVGFGNQSGKGPQVDLLMLRPPQLEVATPVIRWVLVDGTRPKGEPRYALFTSCEAKAAAMGGVASGKQNNLRVAELLRRAITWGELSVAVQDFLLSEGAE